MLPGIGEGLVTPPPGWILPPRSQPGGDRGTIFWLVTHRRRGGQRGHGAKSTGGLSVKGKFQPRGRFLPPLGWELSRHGWGARPRGGDSLLGSPQPGLGAMSCGFPSWEATRPNPA